MVLLRPGFSLESDYNRPRGSCSGIACEMVRKSGRRLGQCVCLCLCTCVVYHLLLVSVWMFLLRALDYEFQPVKELPLSCCLFAPPFEPCVGTRKTA